MRETDPGLERVRKARHEISERFDHDPEKVLAYYREVEKQHADRVIHIKSESEEPVNHASSVG